MSDSFAAACSQACSPKHARSGSICSAQRVCSPVGCSRRCMVDTCPPCAPSPQAGSWLRNSAKGPTWACQSHPPRLVPPRDWRGPRGRVPSQWTTSMKMLRRHRHSWPCAKRRGEKRLRCSVLKQGLRSSARVPNGSGQGAAVWTPGSHLARTHLARLLQHKGASKTPSNHQAESATPRQRALEPSCTSRQSPSRL